MIFFFTLIGLGACLTLGDGGAEGGMGFILGGLGGCGGVGRPRASLGFPSCLHRVSYRFHSLVDSW